MDDPLLLVGMDPCFVLTEGQKKLRFKKESNINEEEWNIFTRQQNQTNNTNSNIINNNNTLSRNDARQHNEPNNSNNNNTGIINDSGIIDYKNHGRIDALSNGNNSNNSNININNNNNNNKHTITSNEINGYPIDLETEPNAKRQKYEIESKEM